MQTVTLKIPDEIIKDFEILDNDLKIEVLKKGIKQYKIEKALERYKNNELSLGKAAQIASAPKQEMINLAYAYGVEPKYSLDTVLEELGKE